MPADLPAHLAASVEQALRTCCAAWSLPALPDRVDFELSRRMTRSLGRCTPERGVVRISERLVAAPEELLLEVLCHELAHVAVHELHGRGPRPHGPEWRRLMRAAGREPRARLPLDALPDDLVPPPPKRRPRRRYLHECPRCGARRVAGRVVRRWRCRRCVDAGGEGVLDVYRLAPSPLPSARPHVRRDVLQDTDR